MKDFLIITLLIKCNLIGINSPDEDNSPDQGNGIYFLLLENL